MIKEASIQAELSQQCVYDGMEEQHSRLSEAISLSSIFALTPHFSLAVSFKNGGM